MTDDDFSDRVKELKKKLDKLEREESEKKEIKKLKSKIKEMENKKKPVHRIIKGFKNLWDGI